MFYPDCYFNTAKYCVPESCKHEHVLILCVVLLLVVLRVWKYREVFKVVHADVL